MSLKYRNRMSEFVAQMSTEPITKNDSYANNWHDKYGKTSSRFWNAKDADDSQGTGVMYLTRNRFP